MKKLIKLFLALSIICLIIIFTGFLRHGAFWGIQIAFGYGGGGGGDNFQTNSNTNLNVPLNIEVPAPTVEDVQSPTSSSNLILKGTKTADTIIFINFSSDNIIYPTETNWQTNQTLIPGLNVFRILAKNSSGKNSSTVLVFVTQSNLGDINQDSVVDDLDLALLVSHWNKDWTSADFNNDNIIDDLDLAILVSHWTK